MRALLSSSRTPRGAAPVSSSRRIHPVVVGRRQQLSAGGAAASASAAADADADADAAAPNNANAAALVAAAATLQLDPAGAEALARCAALASTSGALLEDNAALLRKAFLPGRGAALVKAAPGVLRLPLRDWDAFFTQYGLSEPQLWKLFRYDADALARATVHSAGAAVLFLKRLGPWTDADVVGRLLPCYAHLLARTPAELEAAAARLATALDVAGGGVDGGDVATAAAARLAHACPDVLGADAEETLLPVLERIAASRAGRYQKSGSYEV